MVCACGWVVGWVCVRVYVCTCVRVGGVRVGVRAGDHLSRFVVDANSLTAATNGPKIPPIAPLRRVRRASNSSSGCCRQNAMRKAVAKTRDRARDEGAVSGVRLGDAGAYVGRDNHFILTRVGTHAHTQPTTKEPTFLPHWTCAI